MYCVRVHGPCTFHRKVVFKVCSHSGHIGKITKEYQVNNCASDIPDVEIMADKFTELRYYPQLKGYITGTQFVYRADSGISDRCVVQEI